MSTPDEFFAWYETLSCAQQQDINAAMLKMAADMLGWTPAQVLAEAAMIEDEDRVDAIAADLLSEVDI